MKYRLVIDGNAVYEVDEECEYKKQSKDKEKVNERRLDHNYDSRYRYKKSRE